MPDQWLTPKEAAAVLRVSAWTIRKLVREGRLEGVRLGHRTVRVRFAGTEVTDGQVQGQGQEAVKHG